MECYIFKIMDIFSKVITFTFPLENNRYVHVNFIINIKLK